MRPFFFFQLFLLSSSCCFAQEIAITFDDAPTGDGPLFSGMERSRRIVASLRQLGIDEVAFFVLTNNISDQTNERLKLYVDEGHLLANHSHSHSHIHLGGAGAYIDDIAKADSILTNYPAYTKWFRYPFLDEGRTVQARDSIRKALKDLNLTNGYVTIDNYDWYLNHLIANAARDNRHIDMGILRQIYIDHIFSSIRFYDEIARKHLGRSPKHVLLLHENDLSALFIGDLINHLRSNGWKIISPREAYLDPIAASVPDVLFNGQGRIAAIAREKGVPARELVQLSEDEEYLDNLVKEKKVFR